MTILPPIDQKAQYVEAMFARIAAGYDRVNRVMTFGLDQGWREVVVDAVAPPLGGAVLDVGTGTGDFLPLLASWTRDGLVVGVDFCPPMMVEGLPKIDLAGGSAHAAFVGGDALKLPFADASFDALTTGFALRNVVDIEQALREMYRVARPGAAMACLEVARPRNPLVRLGHRFYFEGVVPWIGQVLGGDRSAYTYLPQSARHFPPPDRLATLMRDAGWQFVSYRLLGFGAVAVHVGAKL
ncbi:ubiquinone/menaquinone biosynthesis methyltransferase [Candidatus Gracilibacteria bacterium]|nr:ubiquinone/menaquinone biosynthesis methyltransferase [Candidatus Gracilibacteria bacterium]